MILSFSFIQTWFTQGALHPLLTASHVILLTSIALLIGQQQLKLSYFISASIAVLLGVLANQNQTLDFIGNLNIELILSLFALLISLLVILKLHLPTLLIIALIFISIFVIAYNSEPIVIPGVGANSVNNWLFGAFVSIISFTALVSLLANFLKQFWDGMILRILGSWIATSTIFILTLSYATLKNAS